MKKVHDTELRGFASDNYSGISPEVIRALAEANGGHTTAYGGDEYTAALQDVVLRHFGEGATVWPMFNGTGANVVGLQSMLPRWGAVICASTAHIHVDEGGAPEKSAGIKLYPVADGRRQAHPRADRDARPGAGATSTARSRSSSTSPSRPSSARSTRPTSCGLSPTTRTRTAWPSTSTAPGSSNAAAALGLPLRAFTTDVGIDALSLGGTKNGALAAEAVVVLDQAASSGLVYLRKSHMQLASKMRFVSAQLLALFDGDLYLRNAGHANAMAKRLREGVEAGIVDGSMPGVAFTQETHVNAVFAVLPDGVADRLRKSFRFYDWDAAKREVRWVCSFDTTEQDVDAFLAALRSELATVG